MIPASFGFEMFFLLLSNQRAHEDIASLEAVPGAEYVHDFSRDLELPRDEQNYHEWIRFRLFLEPLLLAEGSR